ncbi:MAG: TonB-dependent receptor [Cyclobacteriaceae bacterium]
MLLRNIFVAIAMVFCVFWVSGQSVVTGRVTESKTQESLPGVTVKIKGTTTGTITDLDGNFRLEAQPEDILVLSFVGMTPKEVEVGTQTNFNIELTEDTKRLGEVVVIGYGSSSKKLLSGSITQVNAEQLAIGSNASIDGALQAKAPGVRITQNSGTPGSAISVQIRGANSVSAGSQPLYVIDGVPMTTGDFGQIGFEGQNINALADLNPDDIESISVLKDASSAAIYGARAGNGVVLITTKSGSSGKTKFSIDAYSGVQEIREKLDLMNAEQFVSYLNETSQGLGDNFNSGIDIDWQDEIFRAAPISSINLSANGGTEKTSFYISGGLFDQEGIIIGTDYRRINGRINLDHKVNDRFRFGIKNGITHSINNRVPGDQSINGVLPNAISKPPIYGIRDEEGNYLEEGFWDNPVAVGKEALNEAKVFRNISNAYWEYDILPGLTFKNQWGYDYYSLEERRYEPTTTDRGAESDGIALSARSEVSRITQLSTLAYNFSLGDKSEISALIGYSFETGSESSNFIRAINFPSDELQYITSAGTIEEASSNALDFGINSYFARLKYVFDNKYIFTANIRRDGSTSFGQNNTYGNFPGASVAWRVSDESFLDGVNILSDLKLRVGYGLSGNDRIGNFQFLNAYASGFNYRNNPGIVPNNIPNPNLKWESTSQLNIGLDGGVLKDRLTFTVDYYINKTKDLLLNRPLPGSVGFTSVSANVGRLENKGLEFSINGKIIAQKDFSWNTNFNISTNQNKVTELYNDQPITDIGRGNNAVVVGESIGVFYMWKSLGVDPSTGDLVFEDVNNDGQITDLDRQVVGDPNPDFYGGMTNTLNYKGFDLTILFQFNVGNDIYNGVRQYGENMTFGENDNQLTSVAQRWRNPGDRVPIPRINGEFNNDITSHYIEGGSFLRLKNISAGYTLPSAWSEKIGIAKARVYINLQNIWVWTDYSGYDPEVNYSGIDPVRAGTDFFTFPQPKSIMGGINLKF